MTPNVLIREATPEDANGVLTALRHILSEPDHHLNGSLEELSTTDEQEQGYIRSINENANSIMIVAESITHGEIVGVLTCRGQSPRSRQHNTQLSIFVVEAWRGQGVGHRLMEWAVQWAQRHDVIRRIELDVLARNTHAVALYDALGFREEGRAIGAVRKGNDFVDRIYMALRVDKPTVSE